MSTGASCPSSGDVQLRDVTDRDLPIFFEQQADPDANRMAAFIGRDPTDREAFTAHWTKLRADETVVIRTITLDGEVAGHVAKFEHLGKPEVTYWIGKQYWGRGVATRALAEFVDLVRVRPLFACAAKDNLGSLRVLEKCGFKVSGQSKGFSRTRGEQVEEVHLTLENGPR